MTAGPSEEPATTNLRRISYKPVATILRDHGRLGSVGTDNSGASGPGAKGVYR